MLRIAVLVVGLSIVFGASLTDLSFAEEEPSPSEEISDAEETEEVDREELLKTRGTVHGKRGRRNFRTAYWAAGLKGGMRKVYEAYGYPSGRYREEKMGRIEERWTYMDIGKQFIFRDGKLIRKKSFSPSSVSTYSIK